ncbi:dual specificity phosphatase 29-like isoform X4 [Cheilinus undulatus]|uniref:dual specificity phosphatase 29-like isoform X4 n=1 Tax=Cheilinus undulatus TaxID=241271 RepID=UPI001BD22A3C|nr:dual specificity phosphatase 29-like isoform X4 [Cheilinus undulatus]
MEVNQPRRRKHQLWQSSGNCCGQTESQCHPSMKFGQTCTWEMMNAAAGRHRINTGPQYYSGLEVEYLGVEAADHPQFDLQPFFNSSAQFIDSALKKNGKVLVHCAMGVSRSGALVLAYLIICHGLSLVDAIITVRQSRDIGPNSGFLEQLRQLERSLNLQGRKVTEEDHNDTT